MVKQPVNEWGSKLIVFQVRPLRSALHSGLDQQTWNQQEVERVTIDQRENDHKSVILSINGAVTARNLGNAVSCFKDTLAAEKSAIINFADARQIGDRFLGFCPC